MSLVDDLKKDLRLKGHNIDEKNALKLARFLDELDNCKDCHGLDECKNLAIGRVPHLEGEEIVYSSCGFMKKELALSKVNSSSASNYHQDANFDDFNTETEPRKKAKEYALKFNYKKDKGLYISGKFSTGKTYFLSALANKLALDGVSTVIVFMPDFSRDFKSSMSENNLEDRVNELKKVDVLMLDDLGGEMMTSWLRDEIIAPIIQYRMINNLPIFISSNMEYSQLESHFKQTKDDNDALKSQRILERIKKMTKRVIFNDEYKD